MANKYLKNPVGDGGLPRIPTINARNEEGVVVEVNDNEDKAKLFAKAFFPLPPQQQRTRPHLNILSHSQIHYHQTRPR